MAVSAVTAQQLQYTGATDIRQLNQVSPSLLVSSTTSEGGAAVARIRGIGTVGDNPGLEGSVGVFIDGVYRARAGMALTDLGPLDRIEVLRGPQGTLFGRNTSAGLISIITAKPRFTPEVDGQLDFGNFNYWRAQASVTGPLSDTIAARLDAVWVKRDGFLKDVISGRKLNDRDRWMTRGQVLFQPNADFSFRLVGDYTKRDEECCGAVFLPAHDVVATGGGGVTLAPSTIKAIEMGLGAIINDDPNQRKTSITPGRDYDSRVKDWGISGEAVYDFGGAELTSITAYRYDKYTRGQDADFNNLDILHRDSDGGSYNQFKTFSEELRLQGNAFNNHLDWLLGGYYANEKLQVADNLSYGNDYDRYANCLVAANFAGATGQAALLTPGSATCFNKPLASALLPFVGANAPVLAAFASDQPWAALWGREFRRARRSTTADSAMSRRCSVTRGLSMNGTGLDDLYNQKSDDWALSTHDIISITEGLKLTLGARYTHERKKLNANYSDTSLICDIISASPFAALQQLPCVIPGIRLPAALSTSAIRTARTSSPERSCLATNPWIGCSPTRVIHTATRREVSTSTARPCSAPMLRKPTLRRRAAAPFA